jgi:hypothetical protein
LPSAIEAVGRLDHADADGPVSRPRRVRCLTEEKGRPPGMKAVPGEMADVTDNWVGREIRVPTSASRTGRQPCHQVLCGLQSTNWPPVDPISRLLRRKDGGSGAGTCTSRLSATTGASDRPRQSRRAFYAAWEGQRDLSQVSGSELRPATEPTWTLIFTQGIAAGAPTSRGRGSSSPRPGKPGRRSARLSQPVPGAGAGR